MELVVVVCRRGGLECRTCLAIPHGRSGRWRPRSEWIVHIVCGRAKTRKLPIPFWNSSAPPWLSELKCCLCNINVARENCVQPQSRRKFCAIVGKSESSPPREVNRQSDSYQHSTLPPSIFFFNIFFKNSFFFYFNFLKENFFLK